VVGLGEEASEDAVGAGVEGVGELDAELVDGDLGGGLESGGSGDGLPRTLPQTYVTP
jgi:hypothetical protein